MMQRALLFLAALLPLQLVADEMVRVPPRDNDALGAALCRAQDDSVSSLTIELAPRSDYSLDGNNFGLNALRTGRYRFPCYHAGRISIPRVRIIGRGSTLDFGGSAGFLVDSLSRLEIKDMEFRGKVATTAFINRGELALERVTLAELRVPTRTGDCLGNHCWSYEFRSAAIDNQAGTVTGTNLFLHFNLMTGDREEKIGGIHTAAGATTLLDHVTTESNGDIVLASDGHVRLHRSLLLEAQPNACQGPMLGGDNIARSSACSAIAQQFSRPRETAVDVIVIDGRLVPVLARRSHAVDAVPGNCAGLDIRGGYRGTAGPCDAGAFELDARTAYPSKLAGLWYQPWRDGHYVQVTPLSEDTFHLVWNTFDNTGRPEWHYGVGEIVAGVLTVDAAVNQGLRVNNGRVGGEVMTRIAGTMRLTVENCDQAIFKFDGLPALGSGRLKLRRLADDGAAPCFGD